MTSDTAISVEGLSKRYRIGLREEQHDTFMGSLAAWAKSPLQNYRRLRKLSRFRDGEDAKDVIWALRNVSFQVRRGEVVGVIGRNGAGKSTLLKILSRITEPTSGRVTLNGRVASLLEVGTGFHPDLTGRENVYLNGTILGMTKAEVDRKFDEIVDFSGVETFIDTPVKRYSSGMQVRLAFAVAAHLDPELLLIDEVLAVGDLAFQRKCLGKMRGIATGGRTILFVSHDLPAVEKLCDRAIVIDDARILFQGSVDEAVARYERKLGREHDGEGLPPSFLYRKPADESAVPFDITTVQLLNKHGVSKERLCTWDEVIFKIGYYSSESVPRGSVALEIVASNGMRLLVLSSQPDADVPLAIEPGHHEILLEFPSIPFTGGDYFLNVGLAIPNERWLCRKENIGPLSIVPKDVYGSGKFPVYPRSTVAVPHRWIPL